MAPKSIKLVYFNGRGRAEVTRLLLAQAGVEFEDKRIVGDEWKELKPKTPTLQLPYAEIDGKQLGDSGAINVYLAKQFGMLGSNDWDEAIILMICGVIEDAVQKRIQILFEKDDAKKEEMIPPYMEKQQANLLKVVSDRLEGGKQWLVGDKISLADIAVAYFLDGHTAPTDGPIKQNAAVSAHVSRVLELPNIKKWIASRPETNF